MRWYIALKKISIQLMLLLVTIAQKLICTAMFISIQLMLLLVADIPRICSTAAYFNTTYVTVSRVGINDFPARYKISIQLMLLLVLRRILCETDRRLISIQLMLLLVPFRKSLQ